jgi:hypothetical protein
MFRIICSRHWIYITISTSVINPTNRSSNHYCNNYMYFENILIGLFTGTCVLYILVIHNTTLLLPGFVTNMLKFNNNLSFLVWNYGIFYKILYENNLSVPKQASIMVSESISTLFWLCPVYLCHTYTSQ